MSPINDSAENMNIPSSIWCPYCNEHQQAYNFYWTALQCIGCRKYVLQNEWIYKREDYA